MACTNPFYAIVTRILLGLDEIPNRNGLFRETSAGLILRIMNMDRNKHDHNLSVSGSNGLSMDMDVIDVEADSDKVSEVPVRIQVAPEELSSCSSDIVSNLIATDANDVFVIEEARFTGPLPMR